MTTYNIEGPWRGQLAIIARPRGGDWLAEEVQDWKNEGFDVIVSLLTTDEERDLGLTEESDTSRAQGIVDKRVNKSDFPGEFLARVG